MRYCPKPVVVIFLVGIGGLCSIFDRAAAQSKPAPAAASICAPCHGLDGVGRDVEIPNLAGQHSIYMRKQLLAFKSCLRI